MRSLDTKAYMLRDLSVQNYRCFEDFKIDGLAGVNLFVGNNNTGKTSLLEAIYLLISQNKLYSLFRILKERNTIGFIEQEVKDCFSLFKKKSIKNLIHDYDIVDINGIKITSTLEKPIILKKINFKIPQLYFEEEETHKREIDKEYCSNFFYDLTISDFQNEIYNISIDYLDKDEKKTKVTRCKSVMILLASLEENLSQMN